MASKARSAGVLVFRHREHRLEVLLIHPGGPFFAKKDAGAWSIPKGEYSNDEEPLAAAKRELREETGYAAEGEFLELGQLKQAGGKVVSAWAVRGELDAAKIVSNTFSLEWPPRSGRRAEFPEVDRAEWFELAAAREKLITAQQPFLDRLLEKLEAPAR